MIEQQLYSRGSYGLTLRSSGHDTVAASEGLSEEELKELNGYTTYYQSELVNSNGEMVPVVLKRKLPGGRVMFSKRVPRRYYDSSGQRNTFLAHNLIIKEGSAEEDDIIHDVRKLFDSGVFITSFDEERDSTKLP
ncbi:MAG: hypothetical protein IKY53_07775, partial [Lachnospiraceae bacterium]|nr:hypothetical protein [Lachnospiraceae bacterium]